MVFICMESKCVTNEALCVFLCIWSIYWDKHAGICKPRLKTDMVKCECTVKHLWLSKTIYIFRSSLSVYRFTITVNWAWYRSFFLLRGLREVLFNQYLQMQLKQYSIEIRFSSNTFFFVFPKCATAVLR